MIVLILKEEMKMPRFMLDISNDMGKAAEIEIIEKLQRIYKNHPDNYLASLFSNTLTGWVTKQIKDDMVSSIDEYLNGDFVWSQDNQQRILEMEIKEKDLKIEQLRRELRDAGTLLEVSCAQAEKEAELQEKELSESRQIIREFKQYAEAWEKEAKENRCDLQKKDTEILKVKARLYDIEHKEEVEG